MPLFYQQHINQYTQIAIWEIQEDESFFLESVAPIKQIANLQKRLQHLAARFLLKYLYKDFPVDGVELTENGKPYLQGDEYFFSISHSKNYAAVIVSEIKNVALDIEMLDNKVDRIIAKFLNESEQEKMVETMANKEFQYLPTLLWGAKEAMFKYYGKGNVDFKTMLLTDIATLSENKIEVVLHMPEIKMPLTVYYKIVNGICISYIY